MTIRKNASNSMRYKYISRKLGCYSIWLKMLFLILLFGGVQSAVAQQVDLVIIKSGPISARSGDTITYRLRISNNGPDSADGAKFEDPIASGLTVQSISCSGETNGAVCPIGISATGGVVSGTIPVFPRNSELIVTIDVQIPFDSSTSYANTATVSPPAGMTETNPASNTSTVGTTVSRLSADLVSTVTGPATQTLGVPAVYTYTYRNNGPDTIPVAYIGNSFGNYPAYVYPTSINAACTASGGAVCPSPTSTTMPSGAVALPSGSTLTFVVTLTPTASSVCVNQISGSLSFPITSTISVPYGVTDPIPGNNTGTLNVSSSPVGNPLCPPVVINATKTGPPAFNFGSEQSYRITLENAGTVAADGTTIRDSFTSNNNITPIGGMTFASVRVVCSASNGAVCPVISAPGSILFSGAWGYTGFSTTAVSAWPVGGKLELIFYFTPRLAVPLPCGDPTTLIDISNSLYIRTPGQNFDTLQAATRIQTSAGVPACPQADLSISRSTPGLLTLGTPLDPYTLTITNNGPSAVTNTYLNEALGYFGSPAPVMQSVQIACTPSAGAQCPATLVPTLNTHNYFTGVIVPFLPAGGSVTFTFNNAVIALGSTGSCPASGLVSLTLIGRVYPPSNITDPVSGNNEIRSNGPTLQCAAITVNKQLSSPNPSYGSALTYTINVSNASPGSNAAGAIISDALPSGFTFDQVAGASCTPTVGSAVCGPLAYDTSTNTLSSPITSLPPGSSMQIVIPGTVTRPGTWSNTASVPVNIGTFASPAPASASSTVNFQTAGVDLAIYKNGFATYQAGNTIGYTLVATSYGDPVADALIEDTIPAEIQNVTWTCNATHGASCTAAAGSGNTLSVNATFPQGGTMSGQVFITIEGTVAPGTTLPITNTATVIPPLGVTDLDPGNNTASITSVLKLPDTADLSIQKRVLPQHYTSGKALVYTIRITNAGPADVTGAALNDSFPASITLGNWSCAGEAGGQCPVTSGSGNPSGATVNLPAGTSAVFTLSATVNSGTSGDIINSVTVTPPSGVTDPDPANNTASVRVQPQGSPPVAGDISIFKAVSPNHYTPGIASTVTYTLLVDNVGPGQAVGVAVTDTPPSGLSIDRWTCASVSTGDNRCPSSGIGPINGVLVDLARGGQVVFTVDGTVSASAAGDLINTATAALPATSPPDPDLTNNADIAVIAASPLPLISLNLTKMADIAQYTPGNTTPVTYTLRASNGGPDGALGAVLQDTLPAGSSITGWVCTPADGAVCPGSGDPGSGLQIDLPAGSSAVFTINASIAASARGDLINNAVVIPPAGTVNTSGNSNRGTNTIVQNAIPVDISVTGSVSPATYVPGQAATIRYTMVVSNLSSINASNIRLDNVLPPDVSTDSVTCTAAGGAICPVLAALNRSVTGVDADLPAAASLTFTIEATVSPAATGNLDYLATATVAPGYIDYDPSNNQTVISLTPYVLSGSPNLFLNKQADRSTVQPNEQIVYTLTVTNIGDVPTTENAYIVENMPAVLRIDSVGSGCTVSGQNVECVVPVGLGAGSSISFEIRATLTQSLSAGSYLINLATISGGGGNVTCVFMRTCASGALVRAPSTVAAVPVNAQWMLWMMVAGILLGSAWHFRLRR